MTPEQLPLYLHTSLSRQLSLQGHTKRQGSSGELLPSRAEGLVPGVVHSTCSSLSVTGKKQAASTWLLMPNKSCCTSAWTQGRRAEDVTVGGRNNFRMAGESRMPAGSRRRLKGSTHPWLVGTWLRGCWRAGLQQCPPKFP